MNYYPWSEKSKDVIFESSEKGVGDGEQKVASELDTHILGQNSPYDLMITLHGKKIKCDVKKLDKQNDFNTGKEGRDALRPIKTLITTLLDSMNVFTYSDVFTSDEKKEMTLFNAVSPDELAVGTLKKLKKVITMLSIKKKNIRSILPSVPFMINSQISSIPIDLYYIICQNTGLPFPLEYYPFIETIQILQRMDHVYINEPEKLTNDLTSLIEIFKDITVIIADKDKGYMILDTIHIHFYRITRGNPRFQIKEHSQI